LTSLTETYWRGVWLGREKNRVNIFLEAPYIQNVHVKLQHQTPVVSHRSTLVVHPCSPSNWTLFPTPISKFEDGEDNYIIWHSLILEWPQNPNQNELGKGKEGDWTSLQHAVGEAGKMMFVSLCNYDTYSRMVEDQDQFGRGAGYGWKNCELPSLLMVPYAEFFFWRRIPTMSVKKLFNSFDGLNAPKGTLCIFHFLLWPLVYPLIPIR
jgi:hypothetical protein